jgi:anti-sigma regulatory factor (Ser/Thr protein kinase)
MPDPREQVVLAMALPTAPRSVGRARSAVRRAFAGLPDDVLEDAQLLVSEAVTNAIRHSGQPPDAPIRLTGSLGGTRIHIEVADEGPGVSPGDGEEGLGFRIFGTLATDWGVGSVDGRSTTWFELVAA